MINFAEISRAFSDIKQHQYEIQKCLALIEDSCYPKHATSKTETPGSSEPIAREQWLNIDRLSIALGILRPNCDNWTRQQAQDWIETNDPSMRGS